MAIYKKNVKKQITHKQVDLEELEKKIGYVFINKSLLITALTHSSAINEKADKSQTFLNDHNERLEFLGDAILELLISEELFSRFPSEREGLLTNARSNLVNEKTLAKIATELTLHDALYLGKGAESQQARALPSILSDVFEALIAAIYLDAQKNNKYSNPLEPLRELIKLAYKGYWPDKLAEKKSKDYKTLLQEYTQAHFKDAPKYAFISSSGPDHQKDFTIELLLPNKVKIRQTAKNKRTAEQEAAKQALEILENNK